MFKRNRVLAYNPAILNEASIKVLRKTSKLPMVADRTLENGFEVKKV